MSYTDKTLEELLAYMPPLTKKDDFDEFWEKTIAQAKQVPLQSELKKYDYPSPYVDVYDISYYGFDDTKIHGWFIIPNFVKKDKYPCLIHYHGFGGSRGMPADYSQWISMGIAVLAVDCREHSGLTGNCAKYTSSGTVGNVASKGILNKEEYYYRAVYMDCMKAIDFACEREQVDHERIMIEGGSQGGALVMAVASLDQRPFLALADVPSNSNLQKRVEGEFGAFGSVTKFLRSYPDKTEQALDTLSYFDTMNMADRIQCKVLASVALKDPVCPAQMYFATYNRIKSEKRIKLYPFNGHEGGGSIHNEVKMGFVQEQLENI